MKIHTSPAEVLRGDEIEHFLEPLASMGMQENAVLGQALFAPPVSPFIKQTNIPKDRRDEMIKAAGVLVDLGLKTPHELAARLDKLAPNGALRQYSGAFWRLMSSFDSSLMESPDWQTIYAEKNQTDTFRIGEHQFCEPDYRQILLWAKALELEPLTVIERLLTEPDDWEEKGGTEIEGGRIIHLHWDVALLPLDHFEWVDGLVIESVRFTNAECGIATARSLLLPLRKLRSLDCPYMRLLSLDLSAASMLTELRCYGNQLQELDLPSVPLLTVLECGGNQLTDLDLLAVPRLTKLDCHWNKLIELDLSCVPLLTELNCGDCELTELCLKYVPRLTKLYCNTNELSELDLSSVPQLTNLHCQRCQLTDLELSAIPQLQSLDCFFNKIISLRLSSVPLLNELRCGDNPLTSLDLSGVPELKVLDNKWNELGELDLSAASMLTELRCYGNQLQELDLPSVPLLTVLECGGNQLTDLDLLAVPRLTKLDCHWNKLTELDLSAVPLLTVLNCERNQLIELDLSCVPLLTELNCGDCELTELCLKYVPRLTKLDCNTNELANLDLLHVPNLKELCCFGNRLDFLDIRPLEHLEELKSYVSHLASQLGQSLSMFRISPYNNLDECQPGSIQTHLVQRPDQDFGTNDSPLILGDHINHSFEDGRDEEATESTADDFEEAEDKTTIPNGWLEDSVFESNDEDNGSESDGGIDEPGENHDRHSIQHQDQHFGTNGTLNKASLNAALSSIDDLNALLARARNLFGENSIHAQFVPANVIRCEKELGVLRSYNPERISSAIGNYLWLPIILGLLWLILLIPWKFSAGAVACAFLAIACLAPLCFGIIYTVILLVEKVLTIRPRREHEIKTSKCMEVISQVLDCAGAIEEKEHELGRLKKKHWLALDGWSFERAVAEVLRKRGYEVQVTRGSNDGGIDLIIMRAGVSIIAQCKNHASPVGPAVVRELYGAMISHGASEAWLIASSGVTPGALSFTEGKPLRIIDLNEIIQWEAAAQNAGR